MSPFAVEQVIFSRSLLENVFGLCLEATDNLEAVFRDSIPLAVLLGFGHLREDAPCS